MLRAGFNTKRVKRKVHYNIPKWSTVYANIQCDKINLNMNCHMKIFDVSNKNIERELFNKFIKDNYNKKIVETENYTEDIPYGIKSWKPFKYFCKNPKTYSKECTKSIIKEEPVEISECYFHIDCIVEHE